jgi:23S rRNA pseudouridine1911/1915/1917 synthase
VAFLDCKCRIPQSRAASGQQSHIPHRSKAADAGDWKTPELEDSVSLRIQKQVKRNQEKGNQLEKQNSPHPSRGLSVLYEDNHLLVLNKPASIPTMGTPGRLTLFEQACNYIRQKYNKPGKVYLGVVQRLDAFSSGAIVFARTSKAASRLSQQIREQKITKVYRVVVEGDATTVLTESGKLEDFLYKDEGSQRMRCGTKSASSQQATLRYEILKATPHWSLLEVNLITGRKHQIRVQFSSRRLPVWADAKYEGKQKETGRIALHCERLTLTHPTTKEELEFVAEVPVWWKKFA